jgi:hypothetical protein
VLNSYNFFADVRDQHVVSILHGAILGIFVSVAAAIVGSSVLYHFRESWFLDNVLSYVLVFDWAKAAVVRLIWNPIRFIAYFSGIHFLILLIICGMVHALKLVFKARIFAYHAYAVTMWSTPPLLALIPIGMILFRLMESEFYVIPSLIIIGVLVLWVFLRWLKGVSIIYDVRPVKMYVVGAFSCLAVVGLLYLYFDLSQSATMYVSFMYNVTASAR